MIRSTSVYAKKLRSEIFGLILMPSNFFAGAKFHFNDRVKSQELAFAKNVLQALTSLRDLHRRLCIYANQIADHKIV